MKFMVTLLQVLILSSLFQSKGGLALQSQGNWLFIGDSHSVRGFGDGLRETLFESRGDLEERFYQYSISGSRAVHWMDGSFVELSVNWAKKVPGMLKEVVAGSVGDRVLSFPELNRQKKPTHLIIALGTNDSIYHAMNIKRLGSKGKNLALEQEQVLETNLSSMRNLLNENATALCALVLPPLLLIKALPQSLHQKYTDELKKIGEKRGCLIIDSRLIRDAPGKKVNHWQDCLISDSMGEGSLPIRPDQNDGVHFFKAKGEYWGRCAALLIQETWK